MKKESFGQRMVALRRERGITQEVLADRLNSKRSTIAGFEKEGKEPDYNMLCRIADYFGVTVDYLIGHSNKR